MYCARSRTWFPHYLPRVTCLVYPKRRINIDTQKFYTDSIETMNSESYSDITNNKRFSNACWRPPGRHDEEYNNAKEQMDYYNNPVLVWDLISKDRFCPIGTKFVPKDNDWED